MRRHPRRGSVLLLVVIAVALLSVVAYGFSDLMLAELKAANTNGRQIQARLLAESGVEQVRYFLALDEDSQLEAGGLYDNPDQFQGALVDDNDDPALRGLVTVFAPAVGAEGKLEGVRYGLQNESTRLNLGVLLAFDKEQPGAGREMLMALPGMTVETADAILDWVDQDDEPREFGAEIDYYSGLDPPYAPKNGPLQGINELLSVGGVTPDLLFGLDVNRNGVVDPDEQARTLDVQFDNSDGSLDLGWAAYLTLWSKEQNINPEGQPRIYLNTDDMQKLHADLSAVLPADWATFIVAYRQNGLFSLSAPIGVEIAPWEKKLDLSKPGRFPINCVLDLFGGQLVRVTFKGDDKPTIIIAPSFSFTFIGTRFDDPEFVKFLRDLMDHVTVNAEQVIYGRININQAPRTVLSAIPGMTESIVERIVGTRNLEADPENIDRRYATWLLAEGVVNLEEMKQLLPYITAGGDVYRARVVGHYEGGGPAARLEVVIDATTQKRLLLSWKNMSHLGGYDLQTPDTGLIR